MILGMSTGDFTLLHTVISVIAIISGFIVLGGLYAARRLPGWTELFLVTTALTRSRSVMAVGLLIRLARGGTTSSAQP